jgi:hypothetical protein
MMNGTVIGIPGAILAFLAINYYLKQWDCVGEPNAINAFALSVAILVYYFARGLDTLENKERDNPKPFTSPQPLPECFGNIKELLSEASMGPYFWAVKSIDVDQGRLTAFMKFSEIQGGGLAPTLQISRLVLLDVTVSSIPEEEQVEALKAVSYQAKGQSNIQLTWRVDSPVNRLKANELQLFTKGAIEEAVGLHWYDKPKERSPFMPPTWLLIALLLSVVFASECNSGYQKKKSELQNEGRQRFV